HRSRRGSWNSRPAGGRSRREAGRSRPWRWTERPDRSERAPSGCRPPSRWSDQDARSGVGGRRSIGRRSERCNAWSAYFGYRLGPEYSKGASRTVSHGLPAPKEEGGETKLRRKV